MRVEVVRYLSNQLEQGTLFCSGLMRMFVCYCFFMIFAICLLQTFREQRWRRAPAEADTWSRRVALQSDVLLVREPRFPVQSNEVLAQIVAAVKPAPGLSDPRTVGVFDDTRRSPWHLHARFWSSEQCQLSAACRNLRYYRLQLSIFLF